MAGGSTTQPERMTTSRPVASMVGGGPGACTRESSAPAKKMPSRQQTPASQRDPRHNARRPSARKAAMAAKDSDAPSGTKRWTRMPEARAARGPNNGCFQANRDGGAGTGAGRAVNASFPSSKRSLSDVPSGGDTSQNY